MGIPKLETGPQKSKQFLHQHQVPPSQLFFISTHSIPGPKKKVKSGSGALGERTRRADIAQHWVCANLRIESAEEGRHCEVFMGGEEMCVARGSVGLRVLGFDIYSIPDAEDGSRVDFLLDTEGNLKRILDRNCIRSR